MSCGKGCTLFTLCLVTAIATISYAPDVWGCDPPAVLSLPSLLTSDTYLNFSGNSKLVRVGILMVDGGSLSSFNCLLKQYWRSKDTKFWSMKGMSLVVNKMVRGHCRSKRRLMIYVIVSISCWRLAAPKMV